MQVEILSIPQRERSTWLDGLVVGAKYPIYQEGLEDHPDIDFDWFKVDDKPHCFGDLILNNVEFKVVHEKAQ